MAHLLPLFQGLDSATTCSPTLLLPLSEDRIGEDLKGWSWRSQNRAGLPSLHSGDRGGGAGSLSSEASRLISHRTCWSSVIIIFTIILVSSSSISVGSQLLGPSTCAWDLGFRVYTMLHFPTMLNSRVCNTLLYFATPLYCLYRTM